ncbi:TRAP transporter small permease [Ammoniphilus sp. YIM 78166]|uniref:TRAP transporter small permease n=1 Tax=Ammoniphilus sp. YIM 78166 TaxID=1644106 RepID=UPI00106F838E|nr:TRAP transporter small permease [Ammoniphilus sp. YIM 78166]
MSGLIRKIDSILTKIEESIIFVFLFIMLAVVFWGVFNRFLLKDSLSWAEELARYLMIWATFIAASLGVKRSMHISIDVATVYLPEKAKRVVTLLSHFIALCFCILLIAIGMPFVMKLIATNQLSPAMRVPMYLVYSAVPVGVLLMAFRYVLVILEGFLSFRDTKEDKQKDTERKEATV